MKELPDDATNPDQLRLRAEKRIAQVTPEVEGDSSPAETRRLLHELQVHQIELEMQNEEMRESRGQLELALVRYTDLYDFAPVCYVTLASDGSIGAVNLPGAALLGSERTHLIGKRLGPFVSKDTRAVFDCWLRRVFAGDGKQTCSVTLEREGKSSLEIEIEGTLSGDGREGRVAIIDVTERRLLEEKLRQSQKMEVIGQLAGGVAHDFNTLLSAMILNVEILEIQAGMPADALPLLHTLNELATRASSLTRKLLLFSRRQPLSIVTMEWGGAVKSLLQMLERVLGDDITCRFMPCERQVWIDGDPAMLDQAVMNLCLNAKDAMPHGGSLTLELRLEELGPERTHENPHGYSGKFACLRVGDSGCGMDAEVLKRIFEPFFTTKESGRGTGLGLASAHGIVQQLRGWMSVTSEVGRGTDFRIYLPTAIKPEPPRRETASQILRKSKNETVLIAEDEPALLLVATRALNISGYRVLSAANGVEALKLWEENRGGISLLLTDMKMPGGLSGLDLAQKIWESDPLLKVIITSGYSQEMVDNPTLGNSGYTFLSKPYDMKTLTKTVKDCLSAQS
jgi:signal transduction histidine kinase/CheY-like chemotaxis protein